MKRIIIRISKIAGIFIGIITVLAICLYFFSLPIQRIVKYGFQDVYDFQIFPYTEVNTGEKPFQFIEGNDSLLRGHTLRKYFATPGDTTTLKFTDFMEMPNIYNLSFLVIRNDSILFEQYYNGHDRNQLSTVFSISKSVTSLLLGIAIDEGYIDSVQDVVTKYLPELEDKAPEFNRLTIEHLLNMRSGIDFPENYDDRLSARKWAFFYYGENQFKHIQKLKFAHEPGEVHEYQSMTTAVLGAVLERAIGKELGLYLEEKIWKPLGMESNARWSIDDEKYRSTKAYGGLATTARDLAKIGRLYLHKGNWNGVQIVDSAWIEKSTTPNPENEFYQYQWYSFFNNLPNKSGSAYHYSDSISALKAAQEIVGNPDLYNIRTNERKTGWAIQGAPGSYFALGIKQQILYIDPKKDLIVVRLGTGFNLAVDYYWFIYVLSLNL